MDHWRPRSVCRANASLICGYWSGSWETVGARVASFGEKGKSVRVDRGSTWRIKPRSRCYDLPRSPSRLHLARVEGALLVLLVGEHQQDGVPQLLLLSGGRRGTVRVEGREQGDAWYALLTSSMALSSCLAMARRSTSALSTTKMMASVFG